MGRPKGSKNRFHKRIISHGYVHLFIPEHPVAMKNGYVREHRKVLFDAKPELGSLLLAGLEVHHKNGIKTDNRLSNLEVLPKAKHTSITWRGKKRRAWTEAERRAKSQQMRGNQNWRGNIYEDKDQSL